MRILRGDLGADPTTDLKLSDSSVVQTNAQRRPSAFLGYSATARTKEFGHKALDLTPIKGRGRVEHTSPKDSRNERRTIMISDLRRATFTTCLAIGAALVVLTSTARADRDEGKDRRGEGPSAGATGARGMRMGIAGGRHGANRTGERRESASRRGGWAPQGGQRTRAGTRAGESASGPRPVIATARGIAAWPIMGKRSGARPATLSIATSRIPGAAPADAGTDMPTIAVARAPGLRTRPQVRGPWWATGTSRPPRPRNT